MKKMNSFSIALAVLWGIIAILALSIVFFAIKNNRGIVDMFNTREYTDSEGSATKTLADEVFFVADEIEDFNFKFISEDVNFVVSSNMIDDVVIHREVKGASNLKEIPQFYLDGKTLIGESKRESKWRVFNFYSCKITVEIPKSMLIKNMKVETVSGDVLIEDLLLKAISLKTVSGDAHVEASLKQFELRTVSGDSYFKIKELLSDACYAKSVSGDVIIQLPELSALTVMYKSVSGDVLNRFNESISEAQGIVKGSFSINGGDTPLKLETVSGDITIEKL